MWATDRDDRKGTALGRQAGAKRMAVLRRAAPGLGCLAAVTTERSALLTVIVMLSTVVLIPASGRHFMGDG